jgi:hypothetical protein
VIKITEEVEVEIMIEEEMIAMTEEQRKEAEVGVGTEKKERVKEIVRKRKGNQGHLTEREDHQEINQIIDQT